HSPRRDDLAFRRPPRGGAHPLRYRERRGDERPRRRVPHRGARAETCEGDSGEVSGVDGARAPSPAAAARPRAAAWYPCTSGRNSRRARRPATAGEGARTPSRQRLLRPYWWPGCETHNALWRVRLHFALVASQSLGASGRLTHLLTGLVG